MRSWGIVCLSLIFILFVSACCTMSWEQCTQTDWQKLGYRHGARGDPEHSLHNAMAACQRFGIAIDLDAYKKGHKLGLDTFCTVPFARKLAQHFDMIPAHCTEASYPKVYQAWDTTMRDQLQQLGEEHGQRGFEMQHWSSLQIPPVPQRIELHQLYEAHHAKGLQEFCVSNMAQQMGELGHWIPTICQVDKFKQLHPVWEQALLERCVDHTESWMQLDAFQAHPRCVQYHAEHPHS